MPLLCELGWHKAGPFPRWENGFYFSKCDRCGREIVRSERGGWAPLKAGGPAASGRRKVPPAALLAAALLALGAAYALLRDSGTPTPPVEEEESAPPPAPAQLSVGTRPGARPRRPEPAKPAAPTANADRGGVVTASLLNCRAAASEQAPVLRRMRRGSPVRILASRPGWLGVLHGPQRCWVRSIHVAPAEDGIAEQGERALLDPSGPPVPPRNNVA